MYIDELVQTAINQDPQNASGGYGGTENVCERFFWVLQDANYNVLGAINPSGRLIERYEYTPYGQRTVYSHGGNIADLTNDGAVDIVDLTQIGADWGTANPASEADINGDGAVDITDETAVAANWDWKLPSDDPLVSMPRLESFRLRDGMYGSPVAPLCEQGHQGLAHDKEFALIYNRLRYLSPAHGRFTQRDPLGYVDGMNLYLFGRGGPVDHLDFLGLGTYKMGTQPPPHPKHDSGAGRFGSEVPMYKDFIAHRDWRNIAIAIRGIMDDASKHMLHYLRKSGDELSVDVQGMVKESPPARVYFLRELNDAMAFAESIPLTKEFPIVAEAYVRGRNGDNPKGWWNQLQANWFYAVGRYWAYGSGKACCKNDRYTIKFEYHFDDQYNWHKEKKVDIAGHTVQDVTLGRLHIVGLAKEFHMIGTAKKTVTWRKGERFNVKTGDLGKGQR